MKKLAVVLLVLVLLTSAVCSCTSWGKDERHKYSILRSKNSIWQDSDRILTVRFEPGVYPHKGIMIMDGIEYEIDMEFSFSRRCYLTFVKKPWNTFSGNWDLTYTENMEDAEEWCITVTETSWFLSWLKGKTLIMKRKPIDRKTDRTIVVPLRMAGETEIRQ